MVKLFASILTVSAGASLGASICKCELYKIRQTEELHELISYIVTGIEKLSLPLGEIFTKFISASPDSETSSLLISSRGSYGEKIMKLTEASCSPLLCMELKEFTQTLGNVDRDTQIKLAHNALLSIEKELSQKRTEYTSKSKLYKTLSLLISCVIAVLLY